MSEFARITLKILAVIALAQGIYETAEAFKSLASDDYAHAALHFASAANFFTVARANYEASLAKATGGGGYGGRGSAIGSTGAPASTEPGRTAPTVYITIDGGIYPGTKQELARTISELVRDAARDNA